MSFDNESEQGKAFREEIAKRLEEFCVERGYELSPSQSQLIGDLVQMRRLMGDYYCPCQPGKTPETVCVCKPVKDGLVDVLGACFCQLINRPNNDERG
ncbi:MAG: hypothetical protein HY664_03325 [Chloroflexi bacterium]|nr:hypothetical protein [Chloroflexota bacterium]